MTCASYLKWMVCEYCGTVELSTAAVLKRVLALSRWCCSIRPCVELHSENVGFLESTHPATPSYMFLLQRLIIIFSATSFRWYTVLHVCWISLCCFSLRSRSCTAVTSMTSGGDESMLPYRLICIPIAYLCVDVGLCCVFFCCLQEPTFSFWHPFSALFFLIWNWSDKGSFTARETRLNINLFIPRETVVQRLQTVEGKRVKSGQWNNTKNINLLNVTDE